MLLGGKNCCTDKAVCIESATPCSAIIRMFSVDLVLWVLENLAVVVLVNCLACRNRFIVNIVIAIKQEM